MKVIRKMVISMVLAAVACLLCASPAMAQWDWHGDQCVVESELGSANPNDGRLTLRGAIWHANQAGDPNFHGCKKKITITAAQVNAVVPMYVEASGQSCEELDCAESGRFIIQGPENGLAVINAENVALPQEWEPKCIMYIARTGVMLKNLKIMNVPAGYHGICLQSNYTKLENVVVEGANGGEDGIYVVNSGATENGIYYPSKVSGMGNYAINFGNESTNTLTNNVLVPVDPAFVLATNQYGVQELTVDENDEDAPVMRVTGDVSKLFHSPSSIQTCVQQKNNSSNAGQIVIQGVVKNAPEGVALKDAPNDSDISRLQIWNAKGFKGYVGPRGTNKMGMFESTSGSAGRFIFEAKTEWGSFILLPEDTRGRVGQASGIIAPTGTCGSAEECPCGVIAGGTGGSGNYGSGSGGSSGIPGTAGAGFTSIFDCRSGRGVVDQSGGAPIGFGFDSDGDGIDDDFEDTNFNCVCDTYETCWYKPDTDDDGVADWLEKRFTDGQNPNCLDATYAASAALECPDGQIQMPAGLDADGDGLYNAVDPDSDNDAVLDGIEDRNQYAYTVNASGTDRVRAYLYPFIGVYSAYPVTSIEKNGQPVECDLGPFKNIGISYAWYKVYSDKDPELYLGAFQSAAESESDLGIAVYICRNQSLNSSLNFNGQYDADLNLEMNFEDPDTDSDGWCDGTGSSCTGSAASYGKDDACPLILNDPENENKCGGQLPCNPDQIYYTTDYRYVEWSSQGQPMGLRNSGKIKVYERVVAEDGTVTFELKEYDANDGSAANDTPDVFEVDGGCDMIAQLCSDSDQDGIPDCVENPSGRCSGECGGPVTVTSDDLIGLRHYCADTDGDGLLDGYKGQDQADVCPTTKGLGGIDKFESGKNVNSYSCDTEKVYLRRPALACFLDRDGDALFDYEEDRNQDGLFNNIKKGVAGIDVTESNPLDDDTDDDGIGDLDEVSGGWGVKTNPADRNTDDDTLDDNEEDRDGDGRIDFDLHQGSDGCPGILTHDTDPTKQDSDGDGLEDGVELNINGGALLLGDEFLNALQDPLIWDGGGIPAKSDPSSKDSDGDGLPDGEEYSGSYILWGDSNPCMRDSDLDGMIDSDPRENVGSCRLSREPTCVDDTDNVVGGVDSDQDGIPNIAEKRLGESLGCVTINSRDADGDNVLDGDEDVNHDGVYQPQAGETNPCSRDSDSDGLEDGYELRYGTDPTIADSDGDCIPDGVEDENGNGQYDMGVETNALSWDTDGDTLPDGWVASSGMGEDLNCNGIRDIIDGVYVETDPRNPDSDLDGRSDAEELFYGGFFNTANINRATTGRENCSLVAGASADLGSALSGMLTLIGMFSLAGVRTRIRRKRDISPA